MKKFLSAILALTCIFSMPIMSVTAEEDTVLYGDANCDRDVDIRDITAVNQHIIGNQELSEQGIKNCDFFCDNEITIQSLLNMKKHTLKMINSLEPLTYYTITNEEIQEYLTNNNWLVLSWESICGISIYVPMEYCSDFSLKDMGLPEEVVRYFDCSVDYEYMVDEIEKEGKICYLEFYDTSPEGLAKVYLAIKKEVEKETKHSLYHIEYNIVCY